MASHYTNSAVLHVSLELFHGTVVRGILTCRRSIQIVLPLVRRVDCMNTMEIVFHPVSRVDCFGTMQKVLLMSALVSAKAGAKRL